MFDRPTFLPSGRDDVVSALGRVLGASPDRGAVSIVVGEMTRMAVVLIRIRERRHSVRYLISPLSETDLALECVADLFRRDGSGAFVELRRRFASVDLGAVDRNTVMSLVRRLVARKVDDGIFRMLQESDPSLARLIRGLKRSALGRSDVRIVKRQGIQWLDVERGGDDALPDMPAQVFERLMVVGNLPSGAAALLDLAVDVLHSQSIYAARIPVVSAALALRAGVVRAHDISVESTETGPLPHEARIIAVAAARRVGAAAGLDRARLDPAKLDPAKCDQAKRDPAELQPAELEAEIEFAYRTGAADLVASSYAGHGVLTHFEALSKHLPRVTPSEYRIRHRARFEYVVLKTRIAFVDLVRRQG